MSDPPSPEADRLAVGTAAFSLLAALSSRGERIAYADFAFELGLPSPRRLGWLLTPLLLWCEGSGLPPLPIIVVRRADGLPSGGYDPASVAAETERVHRHDWSRVSPPGPADLVPFALPRRAGRDRAVPARIPSC